MFPLNREIALGRAVLDKQTIHIADLQAQREEFPEGSDKAEAPFGKSNMPAGRPSRNASTSSVFTTSAYLAFIPQRLMAWLVRTLRTRRAYPSGGRRNPCQRHPRAT